MRLIPAAISFCGLAAPAGAALICHAAAGFGSGALNGPDFYGVDTASAWTGYSGATLGAEARAQPGRLDGSVLAEADPGGFAISRGLSEAMFSDTLRIDRAGTSSGTEALIVYTFALDGSATDEADAHLFTRHAGEPDEELAGEVTSSGLFDTLPHRFRFGEPFDFGASLLLLASIAEGETGRSSAEFTAVVADLRVFDLDMHPLTGWTVWAFSGVQYPTPSPASSVLLGALFITRRRRLSTN